MESVLDIMESILYTYCMDETPSQRRLIRRHRLEAGAAIFVYGVVMVGVLVWLRTHPESSWRPILGLTPIIPLAFGGWVVIRLYRRSDELLKRIQVEALAFGFVVSAALMITYGLLETAGFPKISAWWFWVAMGLGWVCGRIVIARRY